MNYSDSDLSKSGLLRKELQGPRPTPLKVRKDSHKIKKPPLAPQPSQQQQIRPPVIIYTVSPKVIHTSPSGFMNLVQRLTGTTSLSDDQTGTAISPAARLAAIEKTKSPEGKRKQQINEENLELVQGMEIEMNPGVERANLFPGILSPEPSSLHPISPIFFSPPSDPNSISFFDDLSRFMHSPSSFNIPPNYLIPSPTTPSIDLFNNLFNL
ncbi:cycloartenol Synthase-like isoform X1 [Hibiscus syriacus]|uniref:Cycloartenol Synthase-like isoform X1 n=1 Tax=Hibiscus syriacus TaxID=106335 RepID=A0A6A3AJW0_HIBSY|nr:protein MKS1-like [Hibiscus syriacus]KAE8704386.1 cycloartenol Synthase-like isoform X1 [Hibiscus syriacus]